MDLKLANSDTLVRFFGALRFPGIDVQVHGLPARLHQDPGLEVLGRDEELMTANDLATFPGQPRRPFLDKTGPERTDMSMRTTQASKTP